MRAQNYFVYILTNPDRHIVLYIGITNDLGGGPPIIPWDEAACSQSNITQIKSFISKHSRIRRARLPAKSSSKIGVGAKKDALIAKGKPEWRDLFEDMYSLKGK
jgi:predicted GIY-YIG superfamily endonuclease